MQRLCQIVDYVDVLCGCTRLRFPNADVSVYHAGLE